MCLILFAYKTHPKYKLILAANRDEFTKRPTAKADFWEDAPRILAGRDLERMGTWLGLGKNGRFSAITNYREPLKNLSENAPSRGDLTTDFIKGTESASAYMTALHEDDRQFNGYNLLVGDGEELYHYSNKEEKVNRLEAGIYGLSNHLLDSPWPKVELGKRLLSELVTGEVDVDKLLEMLENSQKAPDEELPETGVAIEWERVLSPMFIDTEGYGTYCSTVILWDYENKVDFVEKIHSDQSMQHFQLQFDAD